MIERTLSAVDLGDLLRDGSGGSVPIVTVAAQPAELPQVVGLLREQPDGAFVDLFGDASRFPDGPLQLHLLWALDRRHRWIDVTVELDPARPRYPSLTTLIPAAGWYERVLRDELGIIPENLPDPERLRRPAGWPADRFLLRPEHSWQTVMPAQPVAEDEELPLLAPAPAGVVDYPLGPVQGGVSESGHFTLRTVGEELVDFRLQLFYKHRGAEKRAEGLSTRHASLIAERISGTGAFANALAYCQAVEAAAGVEVPTRGRYLRTLFAELERLHNHVGYHADLCQATGLGVGQAQFEILKERLLRLNARLAGHRYLFGLVIPGGLSRDFGADELDDVRRELSALQRDLDTLEPMLLNSPSHLDRLEGTGILGPSDAREFGAVGPIGRASGLVRDLRRDHPYAAYDAVDFAVSLQQRGDALARFHVRLAEVRESIRIVDQVVDALPGGAVAIDLPALPEGAAGFGWAESARGETVYWVEIGDEGQIARLRARPASFANWQAFPLAIPEHNILTDFPVIVQSFGLSIAGADG